MKKFTTLILAVFMLLSSVLLNSFSGIFAFKAEAVYSVGDHIQYGNYPQSLVEDNSIISVLDGINKKWKSYNYCYNIPLFLEYAKINTGDFMVYADIDIDGDGLRDYRAVKFDNYRPNITERGLSEDESFQDDNGYYPNIVYYFKYEPITWRILDPEVGLIMTENLLDSQAYNNLLFHSGTSFYTCYGNVTGEFPANDYVNSSIRLWLNKDFYNTAFTQVQADNIKKVRIYNSSWNYTHSSKNSKDKIYLLSYHEAMTVKDGFSEEPLYNDYERRAKGTDYAKCQGLYVRPSSSSYSGYSSWLLRSPYNDSENSCGVNYRGDSSNYDYYGANWTEYGIRPVCRLSSLKNDTAKTSSNNNIGIGAECLDSAHFFDEGLTKKPATCNESGEIEYHCVLCGEFIKKRALPKIQHTEVIIPEVPATCQKDGATQGIKCSVCNTILEAPKIISAEGHEMDDGTVTKAATCTENGTKSYKCTICDKTIKTETIAKKAHIYKKVVTKATLTADGKVTSTCSVCGSKKTTPVIYKASGVKLSVTSYTYNGKVQKPTLTVKDSKGNTISTSNYTATWSNASSKAVGLYTVKLTFKGNYYGTKTLTYKILPQQVTGLKASKVNTTSIVLTWTKVTGAKYYKVEQSTDGKTWKIVATVSNNTATVKSLKAGTKYQFRVTALDSTKTLAGKVSAVLKTSTLTTAPTVSLTAKSKSAVASWKKVSGASKYIVYKSTNEKKWTKVTTTDKLTYTLTKLTGGTKIYVKVVAVNAYGKESAASAVKNVMVKK